MYNIIKLIRVRQWIKNFFCFAPILFAGQLLNKELFLINLLAFFAFCGISSCVYIINDIIDIEADRVHKKKRFRPIASGEISIKQAVIILVIIFVITALVSSLINFYFILTVAVYFIINFFYSLKLKHIVLLDVFFISFGFMLRVIGGAAAIQVSLSSWMILTTIFISLFLAISKRRAELSQIELDNLDKQRKVLNDYGIIFTDQMNTIAATGTIICYALYTVSEKAVSTFHTENLIYTTPFVIYGIFRYLYLIHKRNLGESPTQIATKDIPILLTTVFWFIASVLIIYKDKIFHR
jgi:4-hydroxybenzoate polyprenyltransferase